MKSEKITLSINFTSENNIFFRQIAFFAEYDSVSNVGIKEYKSKSFSLNRIFEEKQFFILINYLI
jgi:hypothetical protein